MITCSAKIDFFRLELLSKMMVDIESVFVNYDDNIYGLMQERHNSSALAMELRLSWTNPSIESLLGTLSLTWINPSMDK